MLTTDRRADRRRRRAGSRCRRTNSGALVVEVQRGIDHRDAHPAHGIDRRLGRRRRALADGTAGLPWSGRDDLGEDRQRDLLGSSGTDVESRGSVHAGLHRRADVDRSRAPPRLACGWPRGRRRERRPAARRRARPPRPGRAMRSRPLRCRRAVAPSYAAPAWPSGPTRSSSARAMGVSPATTTSGAGMTGSRKISNVPPDRHGLCTVSEPGSRLLRAPA